MSDDPSLTDFFEESPDDDAVSPADVTYEWDADGVACPDCGETIERRWRDGETFVCADCKDW